MDRRRMMLNQDDKVVVTFQEFVDALVLKGFPTGTDSIGFYVDVHYRYNPQDLHEFEGVFKPNTSYEIYIRNDRSTPGYSNLSFRYTDGSALLPRNIDKYGASNYSDATKTLSYMTGQNYSAFKIYDFYIKEV